MRRSEYMSKKEIKEENMRRVAEWGDAAKGAAILVGCGFTGVVLIDIIFVAVCMLFGVW